jgi:hypothetical protein
MLHVYRANILFARNDLDASIASYQTALRLAPDLAAAAQGLRNAQNTKAKAQAQAQTNANRR